MRMSIKLLIHDRILNPKIRAQIDDFATKVQQRNRELGRDAMRERQKNDFRLLRKDLGFRFTEPQCPCAWVIGEFRENLAEALPRVLPRSDCGQFNLGMREKNSNQF